LDLRKFKSGVYFLNIDDFKTKSIHRIIKQ